MSNKRNYKNYPISNIEDALEVLGRLISGVQINLENTKCTQMKSLNYIKNTRTKQK